MEAMNGLFSISMLDGFNQDFAIRRFCPARVEEEQCVEQETSDEMELSSLTLSNSISESATSLEEELQFVDSFLNVECYEKESNEEIDQHEMIFDHPREEFENFPGIDVCGDVPMLIEGDELESCSSYDDLGFVAENVASVEEMQHAVDQGLHLVHSLLACAEAVGCRDTKLANSMLSQIWPWVSPWGDSLQRVAYCFAMGLKSRLSLLHNVNANGTFTNGATGDSIIISREEKIEAFHLLHQTTPYIAFGFLAANEAISEAAKEKDLLHIIDLGTEHSFQWHSLIRRFASRLEGAPKLLRITCINEDRDTLSDLEASIVDEARSLGIHLEFHTIAEPITPLLRQFFKRSRN